jgi:hypothetical protein
MNNFPQTVNYIASAIDMVSKNTSSSARQIASTSSNNPRNGQNQGDKVEAVAEGDETTVDPTMVEAEGRVIITIRPHPPGMDRVMTTGSSPEDIAIMNGIVSPNPNETAYIGNE